MPFVRVDLRQGKSPEFKKTIGEVIYRAMVDVINVPEGDKFQVFHDHAPGDVNVTDAYMGNTYSADVILIQITLNAGRSVELKRAFYERIATGLHEKLKVRLDDVVISLTEVTKENWSFGGGKATYSP